MKSKVYFLIDSEGSIILASLSKPEEFDEAHYTLVEKELQFPEDFQEFSSYHLERLLNRSIDQVELA